MADILKFLINLKLFPLILKFEKIIKVLPKLKSVEGRLEKIGEIKNNSKVILDYAHTPAALELALLNLR